MSNLDDVIKEFLVESYENLDQLDRNLVVLEQNPGAQDVLASIFRTLHTLKGSCGFLGFEKLETVAHVGENLLSRLREGHLRVTPAMTTALLALVDAVRQMLACIEATGQDGQGDYTALVETLTHLQETSDPRTAQATGADPKTISPLRSVSPRQSFIDPVRKQKRRKAPAADQRVETQVVPAPQSPVHSAASPVSDPQTVDSGLQPSSQDLQSAEARTTLVSDSTIRVDVGLLDRLMNLVGELVLARNHILQVATTQKDPAFGAISQRLNLITTELQEEVMRTRMQPIGTVWSKLPRVVRDLAISCGKHVRVEMEGKGTELDKTIIEAMKDPFTHLVRNAVDHGIESPEARLAAGKPAEGRLLLRAFHEGGQVNIEIVDDGAGINCERIKQKAMQRGLMPPEHVARMNEREALPLIFLPGFSTAEKITNVSGRGVGLDVVKTNIEKIGGTIEVHSQVGLGTTFKIKIPLTLAIIPALIVASGGDRYAIPQGSVRELVRLEEEETLGNLEMIHGAPVYRLRGHLLPLVYLNRELGLRPAPAGDPADRAVNIIVLYAGERQFGLVVDDVYETQEIVVKPLGKQLKGLSVFAGATIMGDGKVALILDVLGIAYHAGIVSEVRDRTLQDGTAQLPEAKENHELFLLCQAGDTAQLALPLSLVMRLEELPCSTIEKVGNQEVVQYRGRIMPLVRLSRGAPAAAEQDLLHVVVCADQGRSVGLIVDRVLDIIEHPWTSPHQTSRANFLGTTVMQHRVTELLDVSNLIRTVAPGCNEELAAESLRG
jgi:two-component system chemotaxis sensor kinase CheA